MKTANILTISLLVSTVAVGAQAAQVSYIGYDDSVSSLAEMTNSVAAQSSFISAASPNGLIDFESALPSGVTITGGSTTNISSCGPLCGFNTTSGGQYFHELFGGEATINFSTPIDAFGMFVTGLQTDIVVGQTLTYSDGSSSFSLLTPNTVNGGGAFIGFTDFGMNVMSVTYNAQAGSVGDIVSLDDALYHISPVPEPETYIMMLVGLGLLGFAARRRQQNA